MGLEDNPPRPQTDNFAHVYVAKYGVGDVKPGPWAALIALILISEKFSVCSSSPASSPVTKDNYPLLFSAPGRVFIAIAALPLSTSYDPFLSHFFDPVLSLGLVNCLKMYRCASRPRSIAPRSLVMEKRGQRLAAPGPPPPNGLPPRSPEDCLTREKLKFFFPVAEH